MWEKVGKEINVKKDKLKEERGRRMNTRKILFTSEFKRAFTLVAISLKGKFAFCF
jgi:hypothetical protein